MNKITIQQDLNQAVAQPQPRWVIQIHKAVVTYLPFADALQRDGQVPAESTWPGLVRRGAAPRKLLDAV